MEAGDGGLLGPFYILYIILYQQKSDAVIVTATVTAYIQTNKPLLGASRLQITCQDCMDSVTVSQ